MLAFLEHPVHEHLISWLHALETSGTSLCKYLADRAPARLLQAFALLSVWMLPKL